MKLAALNMLKDARGENLTPRDYGETAMLLAYCAIGRDAFVAANGDVAAAAAERRIEAAIEAGDGFDASLIILALQSKIMHPGVRAEYQLESD